MGCGKSKDAKDDEIKSEFEPTKIAATDEYFNKVGELLKKAEEIRSGLTDNRERGAELSHTYKLAEAKYSDIVQVLFWSLSADKGGKIKDTNLEFTSENPYVQLKQNNVSADAYNLYDSYFKYIQTVTSGPKSLKEIIDKIQELVQETKTIGEKTKDEIQNSGLGLSDKMKGLAALGKNTVKVPKELAKCQKLAGLLEQAAKDIKELVPQLKDLYTKADETGAKAVAANLKLPGEIFEKFHTGARKAEFAHNHEAHGKADTEKKDDKADKAAQGPAKATVDK